MRINILTLVMLIIVAIIASFVMLLIMMSTVLVNQYSIVVRFPCQELFSACLYNVYNQYIINMSNYSAKGKLHFLPYISS